MVGRYLAFHWLYHSRNFMVYISLLYKSSEYLISAGGEFFYRKPAQLGETTGRLPFLDGASRSSPRSPKISRNLITFGNDCNCHFQFRNYPVVDFLKTIEIGHEPSCRHTRPKKALKGSDAVPELNLTVSLHPDFGFGVVGVGWPTPTLSLDKKEADNSNIS